MRPPKPFAQIPTRVAYLLPNWTYIGKPNLGAYLKFRRILQSFSYTGRHGKWVALEFDRGGVFRRHSWRELGAMDRSLLAYYYVGVDTRNQYAGYITSIPHSVRRLVG